MKIQINMLLLRIIKILLLVSLSYCLWKKVGSMFRHFARPPAPPSSNSSEFFTTRDFTIHGNQDEKLRTYTKEAAVELLKAYQRHQHVKRFENNETSTPILPSIKVDNTTKRLAKKTINLYHEFVDDVSAIEKSRKVFILPANVPNNLCKMSIYVSQENPDHHYREKFGTCINKSNSYQDYKDGENKNIKKENADNKTFDTKTINNGNGNDSKSCNTITTPDKTEKDLTSKMVKISVSRIIDINNGHYQDLFIEKLGIETMNQFNYYRSREENNDDETEVDSNKVFHVNTNSTIDTVKASDHLLVIDLEKYDTNVSSITILLEFH